MASLFSQVSVMRNPRFLLRCGLGLGLPDLPAVLIGSFAAQKAMALGGGEADAYHSTL